METKRGVRRGASGPPRPVSRRPGQRGMRGRRAAVRAPRRCKPGPRSLAFEDALPYHPKQINRLTDDAPGVAVQDPVHGLELPPGRLPIVHAEEAVGEEIVVPGSQPRPFILRGPDGTRRGRLELLADAGQQPVVTRAGFVLVPAAEVQPSLEMRFGHAFVNLGALGSACRLTGPVEHHLVR